MSFQCINQIISNYLREWANLFSVGKCSAILPYVYIEQTLILTSCKDVDMISEVCYYMNIRTFQFINLWDAFWTLNLMS